MKNKLNYNNIVIGEKYWVLGLRKHFKSVINLEDCKKEIKDIALIDVLKHCTLKKSYNKNYFSLTWRFRDDKGEINDKGIAGAFHDPK